MIDVLQNRVSLQTLPTILIQPLEEKTPFLAIIMFRFRPFVFGSEDDGTLRYSSTTGLGRLEGELSKGVFFAERCWGVQRPRKFTVNCEHREVWIFTLGSEHPRSSISGLSLPHPPAISKLETFQGDPLAPQKSRMVRFGLVYSLFEQR